VVTDARPIRDEPASTAPSGAPSGQAPGSGVRSLEGPGLAAERLLVGMACLAAVGVVLRLMEIILLSGSLIGSSDALAASDRRLAAMEIVWLLGVVVTGVVVIVWFNRAYRNLPALGVEPGTRPIWAVIGWLVPFASVAMPPQLMSETWRASPPPTRPGRPRVSSNVGWWWALFLGGALLRRLAAGAQAGATSPDDYQFGSYVDVVALLALLGAALLLAGIVRDITQGQEARARDLGVGSDVEPEVDPEDDDVSVPAPWATEPAWPDEPDRTADARDRRRHQRRLRQERRARGVPRRSWLRSPSTRRWAAIVAVGGMAVVGAAFVLDALRTEARSRLGVGAGLLGLVVVAVVLATLRAPEGSRRFARLGAAITVTLVAAGLSVAVRSVDPCQKRGPVDLAGCNFTADDLSGADLAGADLSRARLARANLEGADLSAAILTGADLTGANLRRAKMRNALLEGSRMGRVDLSGADLAGARLAGVGLDGARLVGTSLVKAHLERAHLSGASLSRASLSDVSLQGAELSHVDFSYAKAVGAELSGAHVTDSLFVGVDLTDADLQGADLSNTRIESSNLSRVDATGANLTGVTMSSVDLSGSALLGTIGLSDAALAAALGTPEAALSRALRKGGTDVEKHETVVAALGRVCGGEPAGGTRQYVPGPGLHPLVVSGPGGSDNPGATVRSAADTRDWEPAATRFAELVVCVGDQESESVELCGTYRIFGSNELVTESRLQVHRDVQLRAAATGAVVAETRFLGEMPRPCQAQESFSFFEVQNRAGSFSGGDVEGADIVAWVAGIADA
jgi:uncharacterized protein YjbI with pentapeptide repeats